MSRYLVLARTSSTQTKEAAGMHHHDTLCETIKSAANQLACCT